ncbi:MAG: hypothetical protein KQH67_08220 [Bacteroidetes bacterium]|nr:hypothetical protein [Bacteroidota bacterium]
MKRYSFILLTILLSIYSYSQTEKILSLDHHLKTRTITSYGAPLVNFTQMNKNWGVLIGGKGGVLINQKFSFGGIGMGMVKDPKFNGAGSPDFNNNPLEVSLGSGGLFVEYIFNFNFPVSLSIPVNLMAGGVSVKDTETDTKIESSGIYILEPGINVAFRVSANFAPTINVSYRQVFGSDLENLTNKEISGLNLGLILKFGNFN